MNGIVWLLSAGFYTKMLQSSVRLLKAGQLEAEHQRGWTSWFQVMATCCHHYTSVIQSAAVSWRFWEAWKNYECIRQEAWPLHWPSAKK